MNIHTPGPWTVQGNRVEAADATTVAAFDKFIAPSAADARLIAAAPDLLVALGQTLNAMIHLELSDSSKKEWEAAKAVAYAAIAKATA